MNRLASIAASAAVLIGFGLACPAQAKPSLTADPSEVVFYVKSDTLQKSTIVDWDADGHKGPIAVYYTTNGANEALFATGKKGPQTAGFIKQNNTYEFCLWGDDHQHKLTCATVTTKVVQVNLKFGFIHDVKPVPGGHTATIGFTTERSSLPILQVSKTPPLKFPAISAHDVPAFGQGAEVFTKFAGVGVSHAPDVPNLEPDKDFFFVITANDKQTGLWFKVAGKFHTLRRSVSVNFGNVKVVDDSDDLSPGDLMFGFSLDGKGAPNGKAMTFGTHASTGETKSVNINGSITNAPQILTLKAVGYDDDEMEWIPVGPFVAILSTTCGAFPVDPGSTEGQNECGEWSSGVTSFNLEALAQNAANPDNFTQPFTLQVRPHGDDSEVAFDLTGSFHVTYAP